jgi:hypothetical protein
MRNESPLAAIAFISCATLLPVCALSAFSDGVGSKIDPYIVTKDDLGYDSGNVILSLDGSAYYSVDSTLDCSGGDHDSIIKLGVSNAFNYFTLTGDNVTLSCTNVKLGSNAKSSGTAYICDYATWSIDSALTVGINGVGTVYVGIASIYGTDYITGGTVETGSISCASSSGSAGSIFSIGEFSVVNTGAITLASGANSFGYLAAFDYGTINCTSCVLGADDDATAYGQIDVYDSGSFNVTGDLVIGDSAFGYIDIYNGGSVVNDGSCYLGNTANVEGDLWVSYAGSYFATAGNLVVGNLGTGDARAVNDALIAVSGTLTCEDDMGTIYLAGGFIAVNGYWSTGAFLTDYNVMIYDGQNDPYDESGADYSEAGTSDLTRWYYATEQDYEASAFPEFFGDVDLTGYSIFSAGAAYVSWADVSEYDNDSGLYTSSWFGSFYKWPLYGDWIFHENHGWLYVGWYDCDGTGIIVWDCAAGSWCYTNASIYPYIYNYSTGSWYYYYKGSAPNRTFWSFKDGSYVTD